MTRRHDRVHFITPCILHSWPEPSKLLSVTFPKSLDQRCMAFFEQKIIPGFIVVYSLFLLHHGWDFSGSSL